MNCQQLAEQVSKLQPQLTPVEVARLCLVILSQCDEPQRLGNPDYLQTIWKHASFRLEAASDQHDGVSEELQMMCVDGPVQFTPDQLWILLRAIKVQSQLLELYTQEPVCV